MKPRSESFLCGLSLRITRELPLIEIHSKWGTSEYRGNPNPLKKIHPGPIYAVDLLNRGLRMGFIGGTDTHATMPAGFGIEHLDRLPGMTAVATKMMKKWMERGKLPPVSELIGIAREGGAILYACATTMGVMGLKKEDLIDGVSIAGASTYLEYAAEAEVNLFI